jgi:hypothetical protein
LAVAECEDDGDEHRRRGKSWPLRLVERERGVGRRPGIGSRCGPCETGTMAPARLVDQDHRLIECRVDRKIVVVVGDQSTRDARRQRPNAGKSTDADERVERLSAVEAERDAAVKAMTRYQKRLYPASVCASA